MDTAYASIALLTGVTLAFAFIAIHRSPQKLQTTLYIVAAILACGVVGAVSGLASVNPDAADLLALLSANILVIMILQFFRVRRSSRKFRTVSYVVTVVLACGIVGAAIRLAFANSHSAGLLAAFLMLAGGIAVSIEQIWKYRNAGAI